MGKNTRYVGLDVHAETVSAAVAEGRQRVRSLGKFANTTESIRKFVEKLGDLEEVKVCYEAGPTGYALYWQLTRMGVQCEVVAPSLIPRKPSERIKTDRRDAEKLAECYQSGTLTTVWVPDAAHEALRDLVRQRGAAKADESRAKHRCATACATLTAAEHGRTHGGDGYRVCDSNTKLRMSPLQIALPKSSTWASA